MITIHKTRDGKINLLDTETNILYEDCYIKSMTYEDIKGQEVIIKNVTANIIQDRYIIEDSGL